MQQHKKISLILATLLVMAGYGVYGRAESAKAANVQSGNMFATAGVQTAATWTADAAHVATAHYKLVADAANGNQCDGNASYVYTNALNKLETVPFSLTAIPAGTRVYEAKLANYCLSANTAGGTAVVVPVVYRDGVEVGRFPSISVTGNTPVLVRPNNLIASITPFIKSPTSKLEFGFYIQSGTGGVRWSFATLQMNYQTIDVPTGESVTLDYNQSLGRDQIDVSWDTTGVLVDHFEVLRFATTIPQTGLPDQRLFITPHYTGEPRVTFVDDFLPRYPLLDEDEISYDIRAVGIDGTVSDWSYYVTGNDDNSVRGITPPAISIPAYGTCSNNDGCCIKLEPHIYGQQGSYYMLEKFDLANNSWRLVTDSVISWIWSNEVEVAPFEQSPYTCTSPIARGLFRVLTGRSMVGGNDLGGATPIVVIP